MWLSFIFEWGLNNLWFNIIVVDFGVGYFLLGVIGWRLGGGDLSCNSVILSGFWEI